MKEARMGVAERVPLREKIRWPLALAASIGTLAAASVAESNTGDPYYPQDKPTIASLIQEIESGHIRPLETSGTSVRLNGLSNEYAQTQTKPEVVMIDDDLLKQSDPEVALTQAQKLADAGATAVRETMVWVPGQPRPSEEDLTALDNSVEAANAAGIEVVLSVYPCSFIECRHMKSPTGQWERGKFLNWLGYIAYHEPDIHNYIVGNEPLKTTFWRGNPSSYYRLLAGSYDVLKKAQAATGSQKLVGGLATSARGKIKPEKFIAEVGRAYRKSGRKRRIMDFAVHHPYPDNSSEAPWVKHPNGSLGLADYPRLVKALGLAFNGTGQRGSSLPILYGEFGYQTVIPEDKADWYIGEEQRTTKPIDEIIQAIYLREAMGMVACQQNLIGIGDFLGQDEASLNRWQSGLYYSDGTPKSSLDMFRISAVAASKGALVSC